MEDNALTIALLLVVIIIQGIMTVELMMSRRAMREFIDRGYKNGEDD